MNGHPHDDRLQDFLEGLLEPQLEAEVRAHLSGCARCREEVAALESLRGGLEGLPPAAVPPRDLWPQIAWRIGSALESEDPGAGPEVAPPKQPIAAAGPEGGAIPDWPGGGADRKGVAGGGAKRRRTLRLSLGPWQAAAAGIAIALLSGGTMWAILHERPAQPAPRSSPPGLVQPAGWGAGYAEYDRAVADLQAALERGRGVLDPETLEVLEESLAVIDTAIAQAREALERDPGNLLVQRLLSENLQRKVALLRHAALKLASHT